MNLFRKKTSSKNSNNGNLKNRLVQQTNLDKELVFSLAKGRWPSWGQMKFIPQYLSGLEKQVVRITGLVVVLAVIAFGISIYRQHVTTVAKEGGQYVEGLIGAPQFINPILAQVNDVDMDISRLVFSGLLKNDANQELVPDLAERFEISQDQKTFTFYLRQNVKWHDGVDFTVDDVIFTLQAIQDTEYNSPLITSFAGVGIERVDDHTLTLILDEPFAPFLSSLTFGILPVHVWNEIPPMNIQFTEYNKKPTGTGPYKFQQLARGAQGNIKSYTLSRNEDFYDQKPYIEEIVFRFYPDFESAVGAWNNNRVEGISYLPLEIKSLIKKEDNLNFHSMRLPQYTAIFFNQKNNTLLQSFEIREAMALAIDKAKIVSEALGNEGEIIHGPILPGFAGYHSDIKKYEFDPIRAQEILDEEGWELVEENGERIRRKDDSILEFVLTVVNQPEQMKAAEVLKSLWEKIGIKIEIHLMNNQIVENEVLKPRNYQILLFGEIVGMDPDPYPFWHSTQVEHPGLNLAQFKNKDADKLLEEARKSSVVDERTAKYKEFQDILADELPAIFLYNPFYTYSVSQKVKGIESIYITTPSDRFTNIQNWYIKTRRVWQ
ncbi:MAG: ABC transporter substrate-binding protein [Patescibacteria group bacterium]